MPARPTDLIEDAGRLAIALPTDISDGGRRASSLVGSAAADKLGGLDLLVMVAGHAGDHRQHRRFRDRDARQDHEDERVLAVLADSRGNRSTSSPGAVDYHHVVDPGLPPVTRAIGVRDLKGGDSQLHEGHGAAAWPSAASASTAWRPGHSGRRSSRRPPRLQKLEHFGEQIPYGRPGQPAELASTYVYLASQESSFTSGETILVNGGEPGH